MAEDAGEGGLGGVGGACSCWQEARTDTNTSTHTHTQCVWGIGKVMSLFVCKPSASLGPYSSPSLSGLLCVSQKESPMVMANL